MSTTDENTDIKVITVSFKLDNSVEAEKSADNT